MTRKVLYSAFAPDAVYEIIRREAPADVSLLTLDTPAAAELAARIADCDIVICASPLTGELLASAARLKAVVHEGVGYHDMLDLAVLQERGIRLAINPGGTTVGTAEHTVMLMLAVCKRLLFADSELRQGRFHAYALRSSLRDINGRVVGYVGMGRIAQAVAERLKPFGTRGLYFDLAPLPATREAELRVRRGSLDDVLRQSDLVTLHVPLTPETRNLIDAGAIAKMKPGAVLINTARGGIVDESALWQALTDGRLSGAGLDVFEDEPVAAGHPLTSLPNVVLTPHVAAGTADAMRAKAAGFFENVRRFYAGERMLDEIEL